jgi:hypothetical protein
MFPVSFSSDQPSKTYVSEQTVAPASAKIAPASSLVSYTQNSANSTTSSGFFSDVWTKIVDFFKWLFCCCGMGSTTTSTPSSNNSNANTPGITAAGGSGTTTAVTTGSSSQATEDRATPQQMARAVEYLEHIATDWHRNPPHPFAGDKSIFKIELVDAGITYNANFNEILPYACEKLPRLNLPLKPFSIRLCFESDQQRQERTLTFPIINGAFGGQWSDAYVDKTVNIPAPGANQINQAMGLNNAQTTTSPAVTASPSPATPVTTAPTVTGPSATPPVSEASLLQSVQEKIVAGLTEWRKQPTRPFEWINGDSMEWRFTHSINGIDSGSALSHRSLTHVMQHALDLRNYTSAPLKVVEVQFTFTSDTQKQTRIFRFEVENGEITTKTRDL